MTWNKHRFQNGIMASCLEPSDKLLAMALSVHADSTGRAFPGQELLCKETGKSESVVRRSLRKLELAGWVVTEKIPGPKGRYGHNRYQLTDNPSVVHDRSPSVVDDRLTDQVNRSIKDEDRMSVRADAPTANRPNDLVWGFTDEQMPAVRSAVRQAAYRHLHVICRRQEENYLIRTLTRSGKRRIHRDFEAYAVAAFKADPEKWRALLVVATDNGGFVHESSGEDELLLSSMRDCYREICGTTGWDLDAGLIDFRDFEEDAA